MTKAIGIATQAQRMKSLRASTVTAFAAFVLAACGGGAQTTDNPAAQGPGGNTSTYTGPAAETPDVLKFQQEFWSKTKTTDRCGTCHSENGGQPFMFARNDDVNLAYAAAITKIDRDQPALSEFVTKSSLLPLGHNCWVGDPGVCANILTGWIEKWVGSTAGGGRQIVLVPPTSEVPADSRNFPATSAQFEHSPSSSSQ